MSNVYVIENTAGTLTITLNPGTLNGPGSNKRDSDLRLYGMGSLTWGEGVDENFLRIAENFACPAKAFGDYNPRNPDIPYDPSTMAVTPRDSHDLGNGKGIEVPIDGQLWFNSTARTLYVYDSLLPVGEGSPPEYYGGWKVVQGGVSAIGGDDDFPDNPQMGDTYYYLGDITESHNNELFIYDPTHPEADENGWVSVVADYVSEVGGEENGMRGDLYMVDDITANPTEYHQIKYLADPTDPYDAVNLHYMEEYVHAITDTLGDDLTDHMNDASTHLTSLQNTLLDTMQSSCVATTGDATQLAADLCSLKGISNGTGAVYDEINSKVNRDGDTMTAPLKVPQTPVSTSTAYDAYAATKKYVDDQIEDAVSIGSATRVVRYFSSSAAGQGQLDGDIYTSGSTVYVWASGAWRKIFPAVYS